MSISHEKMVELIRADVVDAINERGPLATAEEYGVEFVTGDTRQFIDQCVSAELDRCYA